MKEIPMLSPPKIVWFMIAARGSSLLGDPLFVSDARVFVESDVERLPAGMYSDKSGGFLSDISP